MADIDKANWPNGIEIYTGPLAIFALEYKPKNILEIGIGWDGYSSAIWIENTNAQITCIDKQDWGNKGKFYSDVWSSRYKFVTGRSEEVLPTLTDKYDLIYIDGDHAYEGCKRDIINSIPLLEEGGVIVLDDYGVTRVDSAVDLDEQGNVIGGEFGVGRAADEVLKGWKQVYTHIPFGNGGRAYVAPESR
jgi:predicted O-methyltransferase YrrM